MVADKPDAFVEKEKIRLDSMGGHRSIKKHVDNLKKSSKDLPKIFGLASGCFSCLPMHISKKGYQ